ncbi:hypothetical protein RJZ56_000568 [Blastomyces dermatitidis]|uniref:Actin-like ATPase domain-containing protein n=3 Tax=Blastomyces TaxID=229219 RepID=A0A179UIB0_BLAGS|nr:uncharacterized protein BDBG_03111 [Blastomyces gilchristii SLH14081]XP_045272156.1 uncharacterized protein BDCG_00913 [Blastomyces dermatitidis ER-3]EEQ84108.1 hypothetical protein BDCG_00913 [Blastomyces dermatitidis ER-3]EGE79929.1 hypothetical protein BDDG_02870 [Blastomyces dermatitidis ATCC 18188]OAT06998.1 hypothetical protein BDBG_03111 [Blastomyces gilchristii SLH14081]
MATASSSSGFDRRQSLTSTATVRSSLRQGRHHGSPHTPQQRQILSSYTGSTSPGSSFRHEEDAVIFELGSRYLRAGFEGDNSPICVVSFGPEGGRRVGDYRGWIRTGGHEGTNSSKVHKNVDEWSKSYELWSMDIRDFDIGLFEDKVERTVREVYNKYLLTDAGSSRLVIVLPPIVPHPLLSCLLSTIFNRWRYPSITLLPSAAMAAISAGLRAALVVDIGWEETTVTGLYEYREIQSKRSTRAMKFLMRKMGSFLTSLAENSRKKHESDNNNGDDDVIAVSFEWCEEIVTRLAWCKNKGNTEPTERISEESFPSPEDSQLYDYNVTLPSQLGDATTDMNVPFAKFSEPVEEALFAGGVDARNLDDDEMPLDHLVYYALLALPPDIRGACMSRIIFVGGGSNIPGIRRRIMDEVEFLIGSHGWDPVRGKNVNKRRGQLQEISMNQQRPVSSASNRSTQGDTQSESATNFVDEKLERANRDAKPYMHGVLRQVESLGSWAGASLVASLKVKGIVEIERDKFLQHGLAGASRDSDLTHIAERRSGYGPGIGRSGVERSSWTLGEWG